MVFSSSSTWASTAICFHFTFPLFIFCTLFLYIFIHTIARWEELENIHSAIRSMYTKWEAINNNKSINYPSPFPRPKIIIFIWRFSFPTLWERLKNWYMVFTVPLSAVAENFYSMLKKKPQHDFVAYWIIYDSLWMCAQNGCFSKQNFWFPGRFKGFCLCQNSSLKFLRFCVNTKISHPFNEKSQYWSPRTTLQFQLIGIKSSSHHSTRISIILYDDKY